jgi:hypothetical protein
MKSSWRQIRRESKVPGNALDPDNVKKGSDHQHDGGQGVLLIGNGGFHAGIAGIVIVRE